MTAPLALVAIGLAGAVPGCELAVGIHDSKLAPYEGSGGGTPDGSAGGGGLGAGARDGGVGTGGTSGAGGTSGGAGSGGAGGASGAGGATAPTDAAVAGDAAVTGDAAVANDAGPPCGNHRLDPGEQCDDGAPSGGDGCGVTCQLEVAGVLINEVMADPNGGSAATTLDSNCDGTQDGVQDEYVELVNMTSGPVDLSWMMLTDTLASRTIRHVFPSGTVLGAGRPMVVFGGGTASCAQFKGTAPVLAQLASTGMLALNNGVDADTAVLTTGSLDISRATTSGDGSSMTLSPDLVDTNAADDPVVTGLVDHYAVTASTSRGSPGLRVDGSPF